MNKEKRIKISVDKEDVQNIIDCYERDIEYIKKLENNWNELKEFLKEKMSIYEYQEASNFYVVLNKIQEIESRK